MKSETKEMIKTVGWVVSTLGMCIIVILCIKVIDLYCFHYFNSNPTVCVHWIEPTKIRVLSSNSIMNVSINDLITWNRNCSVEKIEKYGTSLWFPTCESARQAIEIMRNNFNWTILENNPKQVHFPSLNENDWRRQLNGPIYNIEAKYEFEHDCESDSYHDEYVELVHADPYDTGEVYY